MRAVGYAYPWDVIEPGFVDRARGLGVDEVAVAVSYHSARAATPWSTTHSFVLAEHAALYRRPATGAFTSLTPGRPSWVEPDVADRAFAVLDDAGLPASAWVVLLHDSRLGTAHPELTVRNRLGERYPWALCPSHPEVREYAAELAVEAVRDLPVHRVVLESCGQMGLLHQGTHEKTDGAWSAADVRDLSVCHCDACAPVVEEGALAPVSKPPGRDGGFETVAEQPPQPPLDRLAIRHRATDQLRRQVIEALGLPRERLVLHASPDPWATGSNPGLTAAAVDEVGTVVVQCWDPAEGVETVRSTDAANVGAYVSAVGPTRLPDPAGYASALAEAGAGELHLYHLGLAGPARWPDLEGLLS